MASVGQSGVGLRSGRQRSAGMCHGWLCELSALFVAFSLRWRNGWADKSCKRKEPAGKKRCQALASEPWGEMKRSVVILKDATLNT